jgi:hypothetical protein
LLPVLAAVLFGAHLLAAQTPTITPAHKPDAAHKRSSATHAKHSSADRLQAALAPSAKPAPVTHLVPAWPANEQPAHAAVLWDSHGLRIDAANSSLRQILQDVAMATGAKVEGMNADERIFGAYGPGTARDVLVQLLQGSSYNVILIGDQGEGAPRQIVLSSRHSVEAQTATASTPASASASDDDSDNDDQPAPPTVRPGFGPGAQPRTPQQMQPRPAPHD